MSRLSNISKNKISRSKRTRTTLKTVSDRPRLSVHISNTNVYAQIIDDTTHKTLVSANSLKIKNGNMTEKAAQVGETIAIAATKLKLKLVAFDRGNKKYHGRVKALADAARQKGLEF
ncbi:50S ribosomal protein L18 [Candidatus Saccharibacteria bacterium]|nr:50S ribosomal protein L18 [Candidatus Saccharibacteria bacterium]MCB9821542.1 50S ribosomal protein L18 [Candidatus Nomurabacteria bacterium]